MVITYVIYCKQYQKADDITIGDDHQIHSDTRLHIKNDSHGMDDIQKKTCFDSTKSHGLQNRTLPKVDGFWFSNVPYS